MGKPAHDSREVACALLRPSRLADSSNPSNLNLWNVVEVSILGETTSPCRTPAAAIQLSMIFGRRPLPRPSATIDAKTRPDFSAKRPRALPAAAPRTALTTGAGAGTEGCRLFDLPKSLGHEASPDYGVGWVLN